MAENNRPNQTQDNQQNESHSVGNQQQTAQTGGQNNRGENVSSPDDEFAEDLRQSGDRNSSNRKEES
jgi:hypothetical protein